MSLIDYDPHDYQDTQLLNLNPFSYPNFGCYHLDNRPLKIIANLPIEEQMQLSDAITRRYALNEIFLNQQASYIEKDIDKIIISMINATSIGNIAFIVYYNPNNQIFLNYYRKLLSLFDRSF